MESVRRLKDETLTSVVGTYTTAVGAIMSLEEHNAMHDPLPPGVTEHPHSFYFHPVRERIDDPNSPVVGIVTGVVALDASSRGLLPDGVEGLHIVVRNTCGQNFTVCSVSCFASFMKIVCGYQPFDPPFFLAV